MFGSACLHEYIRQGGLKNRAPVEVVQSLAPDAACSEVVELTDEFIQRKLAILLGEVGARFPDGTVWPRPVPGYLEFLEQVKAAAQEEGLPIDTHLLSSGHEPFIDKVLREWGVAVDEVIAEETIRQHDPTMPVKPSPKLMTISRNLWRVGYGVSEEQPDELGRILYAGDDPEKDGKLAANSGVDFVLIGATSALADWKKVGQKIGVHA